MSDGIGNDDLLQGFAAIKCPITDMGDRIGDGDLLQGFAAIKCTITYMSDGIWDGKTTFISDIGYNCFTITGIKCVVLKFIFVGLAVY